MKKTTIFQILIFILSLTSCDKTYQDGLEVINGTKDSLYCSICTYKDIDLTYEELEKVNYIVKLK